MKVLLIGNFSYAENDTVTFKIGHLVVGSIDTGNMQDAFVFLQDMAGVDRTDVNNEYVENMAVLLQSLDPDADAYNGIEITPAMHDAFSDTNFDLATMSESELRDIIEQTGQDVVSEDDAMVHVQDMLQDTLNMDESEFDQRISDEQNEQILSEDELFLVSQNLDEPLQNMELGQDLKADVVLQKEDVLLDTEEHIDLLLDAGLTSENSQEHEPAEQKTDAATSLTHSQQAENLGVDLDSSLSNLLTEIKPDDTSDVI